MTEQNPNQNPGDETGATPEGSEMPQFDDQAKREMIREFAGRALAESASEDLVEEMKRAESELERINSEIDDILRKTVTGGFLSRKDHIRLARLEGEKAPHTMNLTIWRTLLNIRAIAEGERVILDD